MKINEKYLGTGMFIKIVCEFKSCHMEMSDAINQCIKIIIFDYIIIVIPAAVRLDLPSLSYLV